MNRRERKLKPEHSKIISFQMIVVFGDRTHMKMLFSGSLPNSKKGITSTDFQLQCSYFAQTIQHTIKKHCSLFQLLLFESLQTCIAPVTASRHSQRGDGSWGGCCRVDKLIDSLKPVYQTRNSQHINQRIISHFIVLFATTPQASTQVAYVTKH